MHFRDHFSGHADAYRRYRPDYPPALIDALAAAAPGHRLAWDCGTGNGQAAITLAGRFARVVATDASLAQLRNATPHPRVAYLNAAAEAAPLAERSVDLVTVAQALHWFELDPFYGEVRRVLKPGGALAVWCYGLLQASAAIDSEIQRLHDDILGRYWPARRRHVIEGYRRLPFPFAPRPAPEVAFTVAWTFDDLCGYLRTWSAARRYRAQHGTDPVDRVAPALRAAWGDAEAVRTVRWPLQLRIGSVG